MTATGTRPVEDAGYQRWLERDLVPDWLIRFGIRRLLKERLREEGAGGPEAVAKRKALFIEQLRRSPIAIHTAAANEQHYEVPAEFYDLALGPHRKYSCALFAKEKDGDLAAAEQRMLELTCQRARLSDGQQVLELGCGWGSLSLFMARRFPKQPDHRAFQFGVAEGIHLTARRRGGVCATLRSARRTLTISIRDRFDRVVSVEMFEHMRNYAELMRRIAGWCKPDATLFVHVFAHRRFAYPFESRDASDWMARHFFTGGLMPSDDLLPAFQDDFRLADHWRVNGTNYGKTSNAWLANVDRNRKAVLDIFSGFTARMRRCDGWCAGGCFLWLVRSYGIIGRRRVDRFALFVSETRECVISHGALRRPLPDSAR